MNKQRVKHTRRTFGPLLALSALVFSTLGVADVNLPSIGEPVDLVISPAEEKKLGQAFMAQARKELDIVYDAETNYFITSLGNRLLNASNHGSETFHFFTINDSRINAFAVPGGYIGINTGTILSAQNESQLAGVIAHEIAHVTQRHIAHRIKEANKQNLPLAAAILIAVLGGIQNSTATQAALSAGIAASAQNSINFTRKNEYEADRIGINLLAQAGYSPNGMAEFFSILQTQNNRYGRESIEFLRTHPLEQNRIAEAQNRAALLSSGNHVINTVDFQLIQARLQWLLSNERERAFHLQSINGTGRTTPTLSDSYRAALTAIQSGESKEAKLFIQALKKTYPENLLIRLLEAEGVARLENFQQGEILFEALLKTYPEFSPAIWRYAEVLIDEKSPAKAYQYLASYTRSFDQVPAQFFQLQAKSAGLANNRTASLESLADYHIALNQIEDAINQLKYALKTTQPGSADYERITAKLAILKNGQLPSKP